MTSAAPLRVAPGLAQRHLDRLQVYESGLDMSLGINVGAIVLLQWRQQVRHQLLPEADQLVLVLEDVGDPDHEGESGQEADGGGVEAELVRVAQPQSEAVPVGGEVLQLPDHVELQPDVLVAVALQQQQRHRDVELLQILDTKTFASNHSDQLP